MLSKEDVQAALSSLSPDLIEEIIAVSEIKDIPRNTQIFREGQCVKTIPIVLSGLIRVFIGHEEKELLLYYIKPTESCIMLLTAGLNGEQSKVSAITEEDTTVLFLPVDKVSKWIKHYTDLNILFFRQYDMRYNDMLNTIRSILIDSIDVRLYKYLKEKVLVTNCNPLKLSHRQIAAELGTAREVVSRVIKRLEREGKINQTSCTIKVL